MCNAPLLINLPLKNPHRHKQRWANSLAGRIIKAPQIGSEYRIDFGYG